ncbi:SGNH/GDSL hydrolase family protein [Flammeovirga yaeyamensis]|uniref:SGNH/GDSL hydrolase family protein n=1 Tax=Flammeovirga yaeyamensis TaxID=367791 RepID=A0AAX1N4L7_9BACT|nr:SGNH/GDSL hydrolase family protein [Flammeovirga yaeyamensis]MBB3698645.1 lysophospholipase L1-like esterase [Flammeovirga yaeyamensis]NMF34009.1 SGNH/GDSL hydrolase family protein [Flammeovirga yaeyamensis]QWG00997.1 SGNH/GDSL hydrolase family protein [Flammeovirga yaeyamensis]
MKKIALFLSFSILFLLTNCSDKEEPIFTTLFDDNDTTQVVVDDGIPRKVMSFLALGDSYTIGASVSKEDRWTEQLKVALEDRRYTIEDDIVYVAQTGWTTSNLIDAINRSDLEENYDIVTLLIGVNNQFQRRDIRIFEEEYNELLTTAINFAGGTKNVIVLSIPDYGYTYTQPNFQITQEIDQYNNLKERITNNRGVKFYNITSTTRQVRERPELTASDGLHPSGELYGLWVNQIIDDVKDQLKEPPE